MGWLSVLIGIIASVIFYKKGPFIFFIFSIIVTIGCFWSWGIMHNFATNQAKKRTSYRGDFYDLKDEEIQSVPDWITKINMAFSLFALILLIIAIVK